MPETTEDPPTSRACPECGTRFVPSAGPGRPPTYCGTTCRTNAYWRRRMAREPQLEVGESTATQPSAVEKIAHMAGLIERGNIGTGGCPHTKTKAGPIAGTLKCQKCSCVRGKDGVWR